MHKKNLCRRLEIPTPPRALGPPRLAAGAGDRLSETLGNISISHPVAGFSLLFLSSLGARPPQRGAIGILRRRRRRMEKRKMKDFQV